MNRIRNHYRVLLLIVSISFIGFFMVNNFRYDQNIGLNKTQQTRVVQVSDDCYDVYIESDNIFPISAAIQQRPTIGNVKTLAIPIYFSDQSYSTSQSTLDARWDGATASVKHYYLENSYNQLTITVDTKTWILAPKTISYYADDDYSSTREFELATWALSYWDSSINYNDYNYIYFIYAGADVYGGDLNFWPHVWTFYSGSQAAGDGVSYDKIGFVGELSKMGTYAHEFGHSLGLIDYYSMSGDENCGQWELMDSGNHNDDGNHPCHMGAYSKIELGWINDSRILTFTDVNVGLINLFHLEEANCPVGYYYAVKIPYSSSIYYLVEFRDSFGYDAYLPDWGVLWSRVDLTKGSTEGRLYYLGGDHSDNNYDLDGVELDDTETENGENFFRWFTGSWELSIGAVQEYTNYMQVLVNRYHDMGTDWGIYSSLPAGSEIYWTLTGLSVGDIIISNWDTPAEGSGSDFRIRKNNGGSWTNVFTKDNIYQDCAIYRVTVADDYRIVIVNDNAITAMNVYYKNFVCSAPYTVITNWMAPDDEYLINNEAYFTIDVEVENWNSGWDESATASISLPAGVSLVAGETATKQWYTPFKYLPATFSWNIKATTPGLKYVTINIGGTYSSDSALIPIEALQDLTKPTCLFNEIDQIFTQSNSIDLEWNVADYQTGLKNVSIYKNGAFLKGYSIYDYHDIFSLTTEGNYNFQIIAYDYAGNSQTDSISICYDNTAPTIPIIYTELQNLERTTHKIVFTVSDAVAGIDNIEVYIDYLYQGDAAYVSGKYQFYLNFNNYPFFKDPVVMLKIYDNAGNSRTEYVSVSMQSFFSTPIFFGIVAGSIGAIGLVTVVVIKKKKGTVARDTMDIFKEDYSKRETTTSLKPKSEKVGDDFFFGDDKPADDSKGISNTLSNSISNSKSLNLQEKSTNIQQQNNETILNPNQETIVKSNDFAVQKPDDEPFYRSDNEVFQPSNNKNNSLSNTKSMQEVSKTAESDDFDFFEDEKTKTIQTKTIQTNQPINKSKFCINCGKELSDEIFCPRCGFKRV